MRVESCGLGAGVELRFREPSAAEWIRLTEVRSLEAHIDALNGLLAEPGTVDFNELTMSDVRAIDEWLKATFATACMTNYLEVFAYRLALELGAWDVDALIAAMPVSKFVRWQSFYDLDPWGSAAEDYRLALARHSTLAPYVATGRQLKVGDLLPDWRRRKRPRRASRAQDLDRIASQTSAIFGAMTAAQRIALAEGRPVN